jgi:hypothetical protein
MKAENTLITSLAWQYVEDYDFYRIDYAIDYFWHRIQIRHVEKPIPDYMCKMLRQDLACEPKELNFR